MGAEHSQQRAEADGHEIFDGRQAQGLGINPSRSVALGDNGSMMLAATAAANKRRGIGNHRQQTGGGLTGGGSPVASSIVIASKQIISAEAASPGCSTSELSRPPSPPLSVCSDLPYVSYTDRPIGDSPKIRSKPASHMLHQQQQQSSASRAAARKSHPGGISKPKRPQSTSSSHNIVIVRPGASDAGEDLDLDLARLRNIPQFLPVLRESITSATYTRDAEILERLHSQHLVNICSRMQTHLNLCASYVASEQNHLVERTKVVSNSITTLFAGFVDMQKTYASYAEQFAKIRSVSHQLSRCNSLLHENIASLEAINNFLDDEDRLEPFVWRTDDNKLRGEAEGATGGNSSRLWRL
ncbi:BLOC-1-related complex subunit 5 [Drosophila takahashii]|uniref:BLOC-1-related complex subunit 5 n=1 Tax=Drosophila takahashii TaxID=29030 RepID=UPI0007E5FECD|nr:BLOC-1-related complex subunit 5 [Drosophila takahashii]